MNVELTRLAGQRETTYHEEKKEQTQTLNFLHGFVAVLTCLSAGFVFTGMP